MDGKIIKLMNFVVIIPNIFHFGYTIEEPYNRLSG
jgi:hypothetical protein